MRFHFPEKPEAEALPSGMATRRKCLCAETDLAIAITASDTPDDNTYVEVRIDGELVASVEAGSATTITLQPGEYEIELSAGALKPDRRGNWYWEFQLTWGRL